MNSACNKSIDHRQIYFAPNFAKGYFMKPSVRQFLTVAILIAASFYFIGCGGPKVKDTDIIATWGDTAMTVAQFKDWMYVRFRNEAQASKESVEDRFMILNEYVTRDVKLLEGRRLGFDKREDIAKEYTTTQERRAVELLYNEKVRDKCFSEKMVRDWYDRDNEEIRVRHLLIEFPEGNNDNDTLQYWKRIDDIYQKAKSGTDFVKLVDQYSEDKSVDAKAHGDLGFFRWGKMVDEFQDAAWKLKPGELSAPVRTRYGYHIIQMIERRPTTIEYNTSQILVKINRKDAPAETTLAYERAKTILAEAKKSGADFSAVARKYSEDEKTWTDGEVGWVPKGTMPPEYWQTVFTMDPGQISNPVRTYKGYHIIKLHEKRNVKRDLDNPELRNEIYSSLERIYRKELQETAAAYMDSVKRACGYQIDMDMAATLLRILGDTNSPQNMNLFSALTLEQRERLIVHDAMGGIKVQELVDMYGDHRFPPQYRNEISFLEELIEPMLMPKYLAKAAKELGYFDRKEALEDAQRALDNAILPAVEKEMVFDRAAPTEEQMKKYYTENLDKFSQAETRTAFEIMVDDKQLANDLLGRIKQGEDISKLARRYTMRTKVRNTGGRLGPFTKDEFGNVSRKAFEMKVDEIAGPIEADPKTWSIVKLVEIAPQTIKSYEDAKSQIEGDVRFEQQKDIQTKWVDDIKKAYDIKINDDMVRAVWPIMEQLPKEVQKERRKWKDERAELAKKKSAEDRIKLKLTPNSQQEFTTKEGKKVQVKIGEPRYVDKSGKDIDPAKSNMKLSPSMKVSPGKGDGSTPPTLKLKPKGPNGATDPNTPPNPR